MTVPHVAGLPPGLVLADGCTINFQALDPTTGDPVAGVQIEDALLTLENLGSVELASGDFKLVPGPGA